jgi:agmatine/peptidylarginine deiminase
MPGIVFPAEWYPQSGVQITWPHRGSDWADILEEVTQCYLSFSREILKREKLLIVVSEKEDVTKYFSKEEQKNLICVAIPSNDTWARDHGAISLIIDNRPTVVDFGFNAWGLKFAANFDNRITGNLFKEAVFQPGVDYQNRLNFILEGGAVESDGEGTILTTSRCLLAPNRNQPMDQRAIEESLKKMLGATRILWLNHGYLAGDDTDNHIDTLARFCDENTIAYVQCDDEGDEHYSALKEMEKELQSFVTREGAPYHLITLPMADAVYDNDCRLPATYANFLIINGAVLLPFYGTRKDEIARQQLQKAFPNREIIGIDCKPLIKQHGSLHCVTMQFPEGVL